MGYQKKNMLGILFFILLAGIGITMKNLVWATIDTIGNSLTGTNISGANINDYNVTLQCSGTLDTGDIVYVELIDGNTNTIYNTYLSTGDETEITINFVNAATLDEGAITLSGSIYNSGGTLLVGPINETVTLDTLPPTFDGVLSGNYYSGNVSITFSDTNFSGATIDGTNYTGGDVISSEGVHECISSDTLGNTTTFSFTIDTTLPTFEGFTNGGYYSGDITITFTDTATLNGITIASGELISGDGDYTLIVNDLASNSTGGTFTIDTIPPAITNIISGAYYTGNVTPSITEENLSGATLNGAAYISGTTISTDGIYILNIIDLVGYETEVTFTIDKTYPSFAGVVSGSYYNTNRTITFSDTNLSGATLNGAPYISGTEIADEGSYIFIVIDIAGNTTGATFTIDKTYPTFAGVISGTYYNANKTITFSDTNLSGATLNGSPYTSGTPITVDNTYTFIVTDRAGHQTGTSFILDKTAPAGISIITPGATNYRQTASTYTITWNTGTEINYGNNPLMIQYSINGFLGGSYTLIISTGTDNDGGETRIVSSIDTSSAQVRIIATDLAGNTAVFTGSQFKIDSTEPTSPTFTYPAPGVTTYLKGGSGYLITRTGGGDQNLSGKIIEFSINGGSSFSTITTIGDGTFSYLRTPSSSLNSSIIKLGIKYEDKGGLTSPYVQTDNFIVDSTKPTITFTDTNSNRRNTNATGTATPTDALAGIRSTGTLYRTDTQFDEYCNGGSTTVPVLSTDGTGYVYACVQDKAGNIKTGVQTYKIDKTIPIITMPADKRVNIGTTIDISINADVSGISGYTWSQISGPGTITFSSTTIQDPIVEADTEGSYVLQVLGRDNANNVATGTITFIWDITSPILSGGSVSVNNRTATYSFISNETGSVSYSGTCGNGSTTSINSGTSTTSFTLDNNTYAGCTVKVTDAAGNNSTRLTIPTFTINYSAGGGGGGGGGGLDTCSDEDLICTNGKRVREIGVSCQGGNVGKSCGDICVDGDYSGDPDDGLCKDPTKIEASTGKIETSTGKRIVFASPVNKELTDAYSYAYNVEITTISDIAKASMTGTLIRSHLAKMMAQYAIKVLGQTPDTTRNCIFSDMQNETTELQEYAIKACQLGLMGLKTDGTPAPKFNPNEEVNRAIFGTTLSRALRGDAYNGGVNRYKKHLEVLQENAIMKDISVPLVTEIRGYVMLMMMRADQKITKSKYTDFASLRGRRTFVPNAVGITITNDEYTDTEKAFIENTNKEYQFNEGYVLGKSSIGVKYLQYFLKSQGFYTGSINGVNTATTVASLFEYQFQNNIITDENNVGAGYLGPATRTYINPLLKELLNKE